MIPTKNRGFTLIEVLLALALATLVLTPILILLGTNVPGVARSSRKIGRFLAAKTILESSIFKSAHDPKYNLKKISIPEQEVTVSYTQTSLEKDEKLKSFAGVVKAQVTMEWTERGKKMNDNLVTFIYRPEIKKKKQS